MHLDLLIFSGMFISDLPQYSNPIVASRKQDTPEFLSKFIQLSPVIVPHRRNLNKISSSMTSLFSPIQTISPFQSRQISFLDKLSYKF
jgi:hypothetical protein